MGATAAPGTTAPAAAPAHHSTSRLPAALPLPILALVLPLLASAVMLGACGCTADMSGIHAALYDAIAALLPPAAVPAPAYAQSTTYGGFGNSPFERDFGDVKFLDAYFGTADEKIEVEAGDSNVPFTVIFANVGTQDITGIRGQLSMPLGFAPSDGPGSVIYADSDSNSRAGESFALTFFVNIDANAKIQQYTAAAKVDYSRLRESGTRTAFETFDFKVTGDTVVNVRAIEPFLTSLRVNEIDIRIANDGTAPLAGVEVTAANTQTERVSTAASTTNVENVVLSDSSWDLGQIGPGTSSVITTTVYVPETLSGETLRIPLEVSYYNAHGDRVIVSKIVDFFVKGLIELSVFNVGVIEISGEPMIIGEIINEGNEDGLFGFVHMTPLEGSNLRPVTQFIDEIEVDAPVPFNIPAEFEGQPRYGEHDIRIDVRYKDSIREEHVLRHDARVAVPEPPPPERNPFDLSTPGDATGAGLGGGGGGSPVNTLVAVAILIVIGVVIVMWRVAARRRSRRDEAYPDDDIGAGDADDSGIGGTAGGTAGAAPKM